MTLPRRIAFAMVVASIATTSCGREAPRGGAPDPVIVGSATEPTLNVALDRNGVVQLGSARLLFDDDVGQAFRTFHERAPRGKLAIAAHRATLHGRLVRIVDLAKEANVPFEVAVDD